MTVKQQQVQSRFVMLTPKAVRLEWLMAEGKSFDEASFNKAFAIADREFTSDGMSLKPDATNAVLASGVPQMGEVQP
jgi:hypothetical protein